MNSEATRLRWKIQDLRKLLRALENQLTEAHGHPWNPGDEKHRERLQAREILNNASGI